MVISGTALVVAGPQDVMELGRSARSRIFLKKKSKVADSNQKMGAEESQTDGEGREIGRDSGCRTYTCSIGLGWALLESTECEQQCNSEGSNSATAASGRTSMRVLVLS